MSITLLGSLISPFVRKVHVILQEKGLDFDLEEVSPFSPPDDFEKASPLGKIPALRHGEHYINDSSVIARYLDRIAPEPALYPSDPLSAARAEWLEEYADGGLTPVAGGGVFRPRVLTPMLTGAEPDEAAVQQVIDDELPRFFDYLNKELGDAEYFVGPSLTIADISVAAPLANLRIAGVVPEATRFPSLHDFVKRMHARDSFAKALSTVIPAIGKRLGRTRTNCYRFRLTR